MRPIEHIEKFPSDQRILGYICGLIATDGNLSGDRRVIQLSLQESDGQTIEWVINNVLREPKNYNIVTIPAREDVNIGSRTVKATKKSYKFQLTLPKLYQYCLDMGITPRKSLTLDVKLEDKSDEFKLSFIRGAIDGDGTVLSKELPRIGLFSASKEFLSSMQKQFGGVINPKPTKSGVFKLTFSGSRAKRLAFELLKFEYMVPGINRKTQKLKEILLFPLKCRTILEYNLDGEYWKSERRSETFTSLWENSDKLVDYAAFWSRVNQLGWSIEESLTTPKYHHIKTDIRTLRRRNDKNN